jgi:Chaperone of endosialidase
VHDVSASSTGGSGVAGIATGGGNGVYGSTSSNGTTSAAVNGQQSSSTGVAVLAVNTSGSGGTGLWAKATGNFASAIYATSSGSGAWAADLNGNVNITGSNCLYFNEGSYHCGSSDERLKKNITQLQGTLEQILKLRGVSFDWKDPDAIGMNQTGMQRGFIAQEVEKVFPKWVSENEKGTKVLTIPPDQMFALMVEAFRTQQAEIDELKNARRPAISMNANGLGMGFGGLAIAGALVVTRRKRSESQG